MERWPEGATKEQVEAYCTMFGTVQILERKSESAKSAFQARAHLMALANIAKDENREVEDRIRICIEIAERVACDMNGIHEELSKEIGALWAHHLGRELDTAMGSDESMTPDALMREQ
jgi:hypothetical protein